MILNNYLNESVFKDYDLYIVESEEIKGLHYISDMERIAIHRCKDVLIFPLCETKKVAELFQANYKEELLEVYQDILDIKAKGCCKWA